MNPRRATEKYAGFVLLALGLAAALYGATRVSRALFERPAASSASIPTPALTGAQARVETNLFQVTDALGQVDAYRDGRWIAVQKGDFLSLQDVVRTVPGANAVLRLGGSMEIELREKVEIRLDRLSRAGASVDLRRGKVVARVGDPSENLAITARETQTSNEGPARFVVMAAENGAVSVAATTGRARFAAGGKTVTLAEGTQTTAEPGRAPADPEKIPEDVLLSVVWPDGERHGEQAAINGQVGPSSLVTVNGTPVAVSPDGRFAAAIPLREGSNVVNVEAEDLSGRRKQSTSTLLRPSTRPPKLAPVPSQLWKR
ncbi:MAG TPA: hypothetical protein VFH73_17940 [Polyangia bacterium]|nr:hypothetical protein [Polyangia bacterium]